MRPPTPPIPLADVPPPGPVRVEPETGRLSGARQVRSPFHDERPAGSEVELIVLHGISLPPGRFGGPWIDALFTGCLPALADRPGLDPFIASILHLQVSAHLLIRRGGGVTQFVPFHRRAWHAGESSWRGRSACNDFSVGIELEGTDDRPYSDTQYETLARVVAALRNAYPALALDRIVGHSDVAPGRKTDPGPAFDWQRLHAGLPAVLASAL